MSEYRQTRTWFLVSELYQVAHSYLDNQTPNSILEIGCFEGLSSVFFADHFLEHPASSLVCVDPFLNLETNGHAPFMLRTEGTRSVVEDNFDFNISHCKNAEKVRVYKTTSDEFFSLRDASMRFTFIYVDGCHEPDFIRRDLVNSFAALESGGLMWIDDYRGGDGVMIKSAIDAFLTDHSGLYEVVHSAYQLGLRKS